MIKSKGRIVPVCMGWVTLDSVLSVISALVGIIVKLSVDKNVVLAELRLLSKEHDALSKEHTNLSRENQLIKKDTEYISDEMKFENFYL